MPKIFISYSHNEQDEEFVLRLQKDLQIFGVQAWVDREQIGIGDRWESAILHAIRDSDQFVLIISPEASTSRWIQAEINECRKFNKPIIPVVVRGSDNILGVFMLQETQAVDARQDYENAVQEVIRRVIPSKSPARVGSL